MKLFTMGPVQMQEDILQLGSKQLPYFRTEEFSEINRKVCENIKELIGADREDSAYLLTCSGSGAMEAAITSCFDEKDKLFIINGGSFGQRFCDICKVHHMPYVECQIEFEEVLTYEKLAAVYDETCTALVVNMHETSIGKLYDMEMLSKFCREKNLYFVVDAISSFLADEIFFQKWNVDIAIMSSQKAMALPPGMATIVCSVRMVEKMQTITPVSFYFDLKAYGRNMERGQTPFTPAVGIILQMEKMLSDIRDKGIETQMEEIRKKAYYFREKAVERGLIIPAYPLSNALTPIWFDGNAKKIYQRIIEKNDMYVTPSGGALENHLLRVGHLGSLGLKDYDELLDAIVLCMEK